MLPALCMFATQSVNLQSVLMENSNNPAELTKRDNDWAGDAVGHNHGENAHHPGISCPELELVGLVL